MYPPFFFLTVIVTVMASVCYFGELIFMGSEELMAFSHIPHAMWFMLVTMTTVRISTMTTRPDMLQHATTRAQPNKSQSNPLLCHAMPQPGGRT